MSETLWYYTADPRRIEEILESGSIFEGGKPAWFTSDDDYQIENEAQQYRVQVLRHGSLFKTYKQIEQLGLITAVDIFRAARPEKWFAALQPVSTSDKLRMQTIAGEEWKPIEREWFAKAQMRRSVQSTLKKR